MQKYKRNTFHRLLMLCKQFVVDLLSARAGLYAKQDKFD